ARAADAPAAANKQARASAPRNPVWPPIDWNRTTFLATIVDVTIPKKPVPALVVDRDPKYLLRLKIDRIVDGSLPRAFSHTAAFMIHSPSKFFMENVRFSSKKAGDFPTGQLFFDLTQEHSLRLKMRRPRHAK